MRHVVNLSRFCLLFIHLNTYRVAVKIGKFVFPITGTATAKRLPITVVAILIGGDQHNKNRNFLLVTRQSKIFPTSRSVVREQHYLCDNPPCVHNILEPPEWLQWHTAEYYPNRHWYLRGKVVMNLIVYHFDKLHVFKILYLINNKIIMTINNLRLYFNCFITFLCTHSFYYFQFKYEK